MRDAALKVPIDPPLVNDHQNAHSSLQSRICARHMTLPATYRGARDAPLYLRQDEALHFGSQGGSIYLARNSCDYRRYEAEKLPPRSNTARVYRAWLKNHILPYWGTRPIKDLQPRETELWLKPLNLCAKSRAHVRHMLHTLVDFAMWSGVTEIARNPIDLVRVKGSSKRIKHPRNLKVDEFQRLAAQLHEPFRTMARIAICLGLRVSELLALRWSDIDWLNQTLTMNAELWRKLWTR